MFYGTLSLIISAFIIMRAVKLNNKEEKRYLELIMKHKKTKGKPPSLFVKFALFNLAKANIMPR